MGIEGEMSSGLSAFEDGLAKLTPADALDRGKLMFKAGQVAVARSRRRWQIVAGVAVCVAAGAAAFVAARPGSTIVERDRIVYVQQQVPTAPANPPSVASGAQEPVEQTAQPGEISELSYTRQRQLVLKDGLNALPTSSPRPTGQDNRRLMEQLLTQRL